MVVGGSGLWAALWLWDGVGEKLDESSLGAVRFSGDEDYPSKILSWS